MTEVTHPTFGTGEVMFIQGDYAYARFLNPPGRINNRVGVYICAWVKIESETT